MKWHRNISIWENRHLYETMIVVRNFNMLLIPLDESIIVEYGKFGNQQRKEKGSIIMDREEHFIQRLIKD